jgi:hypothetical protein
MCTGATRKVAAKILVLEKPVRLWKGPVMGETVRYG